MNFTINKVIADLEHISKKVSKQQVEYYSLIKLMVGLHTTYRLDKDYTTSDKIREVLNQSGIRIIQGTIGYKYEDIPDRLRGRQFQDTWEFKE